MEFSAEKIVHQVKRILPHPFTLAILITLLTFVLAFFLTKPTETSSISYTYELMLSWESGLWDSSTGGLYFAFQMMLMLVLGHCLALTHPIKIALDQLLKICTDTPKSAVVIAFTSIIMGLFNWGLGLIVGAILARRIGEKFAQNKQPLNYGLIGALGYLALLVWHGGLSGSAPTKIMEEGYLPSLVASSSVDTTSIPPAIPFESTIGSGMNISVSISVILLFPLVAYFIAKRSKVSYIPTFKHTYKKHAQPEFAHKKGAEWLDLSRYTGITIGGGILVVALLKAVYYEGTSLFGFIQPNFINLTLFGLCLLFHQRVQFFLAAIQRAIGDISGILIQFPLYFGILGIMKYSGLIDLFSDALINLASTETLPFFTFLSAGFVNFFVPSGGGQWAIQGPIIIQATQELGADLPKTIMAMAYGDQLTNMLQPFWALPLLGITKLKAYEILPYTFLFFILGGLVYGAILFVF